MYAPTAASAVLGFVGCFTGELQGDRFRVLADTAILFTVEFATFVDFFWEDTISGMEVLNFAAGVDPVDLVVANLWLEFRSQLSSQRQTLFFASEVGQVFAFIHDSGTARRHFKNLLFRASPGDGVFFFAFSSGQQAACATAKFGSLSSEFCHDDYFLNKGILGNPTTESVPYSQFCKELLQFATTEICIIITPPAPCLGAFYLKPGLVILHLNENCCILIELSAIEVKLIMTAVPSQPEVYQGQFGEFIITEGDRLGVIVYRLGLAIASLSFSVGSILVLWQGATPTILSLLTPLFAIFTLGLGISLLAIHIYLIPLHRLLQVFWGIGTISAAIISLKSDLSLAEYVYSQPLSLLGIGFTFAALTGIYFKEAFCFNRWETKVLTLLVPLLLIGHLLSIVPVNIEQVLLAIWTALFLIFALGKLRQAIPPDIGDKSVFAYLKGKRESETKN